MCRWMKREKEIWTEGARAQALNAMTDEKFLRCGGMGYVSERTDGG